MTLFHPYVSFVFIFVRTCLDKWYFNLYIISLFYEKIKLFDNFIILRLDFSRIIKIKTDSVILKFQAGIKHIPRF